MARSLALVLAAVGASTAVLLFSISVAMFVYFRLISRRATAPASGPVDEEDAEKDDTAAKQGLVHHADDVVHHSVRRYQQHEMEAVVAGLAPSDVIGEGGFSTVYRAHLPGSGGTASPFDAALKLYVAGGGRAFLRELDVLLRVQHPRIVRLLGYSDDAGALVLELAPNGTLHRHLHGGGDYTAAPSSLTWRRRMRIAHEVARALEYLHEEGERRPAVVHGDVTSANVLLDGRMDPKLCDFGSAVSGFSGAVRRPAGPMVGSPGYTDPHFLRTGVASKKSDVYSYGVLLLELVTGQRAAAAAADGEGEVKLTATVEARMGEEGGAAELVDGKLAGAAGFDEEEAAEVVAIARRCVGEQPSVRPTMAEARQMLRGALRSSMSAVDEGSEDKG